MRSLWQRLRYRLLLRRMAGPRVVRAFAKVHPRASFVEVGANDGKQHDHLRPMILSRPWTGIMVEPVPYVFERLQRNYGHLDRLALANVAIADRDGRLPFFHLAPAGEEERARLPDWYDALGSFSRDAVLGHAKHIPDVERRLVETEVPCLTFTSLCERHGVNRVDLVLIDTEGYDWEVLRSIDLGTYRPRLIVYEHFHLSPVDRAASLAHLRDEGYETLEEGFDTFCLDARIDDGLTRRWRRLRPAVPGISVHDQ